MDLAAVLRTRAPVSEVSGWRTRVRPGAWAPQGVVLHHTAGRDSLRIIINGRSDLPGPLSNLHIPKSGPVNLVSGGRCNHAGPMAQKVLDEVRAGIAPRGDAAARGLTDGPSGNGWFYGLECENLGNGTDPWPADQLETIAKACAAICAHHGWTANRVVGHREITRRKPDPRGFAMSSMRSRIASLLNAAPPTPAPVPWKWENYMPAPLDRTSAAACPSGGYWEQSAEGGIYAEGGAPHLGAYNAKPELHNIPRLFTALVATPEGGYIQIAHTGENYRWDPKRT